MTEEQFKKWCEKHQIKYSEENRYDIPDFKTVNCDIPELEVFYGKSHFHLKIIDKSIYNTFINPQDWQIGLMLPIPEKYLSNRLCRTGKTHLPFDTEVIYDSPEMKRSWTNNVDELEGNFQKLIYIHKLIKEVLSDDKMNEMITDYHERLEQIKNLTNINNKLKKKFIDASIRKAKIKVDL